MNIRKLLPVIAACFLNACAAATPVQPPQPVQSTYDVQQMQDVVYLKDGGIIRGLIVETRPNESVLIRTADGSQFRYRMDQIERLAKEGALQAGGPRSNPSAVIRPDPKNAGTAALLSMLIPGLGQVYNDDWFGALLYFGLSYLSVDLYAKGMLERDCVRLQKCDNANLALATGLLVYVVNIIDAAMTANNINEKARESASLSISPSIQVGQRNRGAEGFLGGGQPSQSMLQVGIVRWSW